LFEAHYENWKRKWSPKAIQAAENGGDKSENGGKKADENEEPKDGDGAPQEEEEEDDDGKAEGSKTKEDPKKKAAAPKPYTNPKGGRNPYGGWTKEGKDAFLYWLEEVEKARAKPICKQIEEAALQQIRYVSVGCFFMSESSKTAD
jgi:hypothetical protein